MRGLVFHPSPRGEGVGEADGWGETSISAAKMSPPDSFRFVQAVTLPSRGGK